VRHRGETISEEKKKKKKCGQVGAAIRVRWGRKKDRSKKKTGVSIRWVARERREKWAR